MRSECVEETVTRAMVNQCSTLNKGQLFVHRAFLKPLSQRTEQYDVDGIY